MLKGALVRNTAIASQEWLDERRIVSHVFLAFYKAHQTVLGR